MSCACLHQAISITIQKRDRAGLVWAGDYRNILGKVGGSEMEFGAVDVHALDSVKIQCVFLASRMRFMNMPTALSL